MTRTVAVLLLAVLAVQAAWARPRLHQKSHHKKGKPLSDVERALAQTSLHTRDGRLCITGCVCEHKGKLLTTLVCDHLHVGSLPSLPKAHSTRLTKMSMDDTQLIDENVKDLERYPNLVDLSLAHNFLDDMPHNTFHRMRQLETLDLHNSSVLSLPNGIFRSLGTLITLDLSRNQISKITDETFSHFASLRNLDLSRNAIMKLKRSYFEDMPELKILYLARNEITALPVDVFNDLIDLEDLDLGHNYLTRIPFGLFDDLKALRKVNLGGSQLFDLDWDMCSVAKYAKVNKGKVNVIVHKDVNKYFMEEKPCEIDCAYVWPCPKYHVCKGTIGHPKCMPQRNDEA